MLLSRLSSTFLSLPARSSSLPARLPGSLPGSSLPGSRNDSGRAEPLESVRDDSPPLGSREGSGSREASGRSEPLETVRDESPPLKSPSDDAAP